MKKLFIALTALAVLALAGLAGLALSLDSIVEGAIEHGGSRALGVETELASADLGVFQGRLELGGLRIANPEGFESETFLTLREAELQVSLGSLRADVVEVPRFELVGFELFLERSADGSNYGRILEHLERGQEAGEPSEPADRERDEQEQDAKKFVIREVVLRDITAHLDLLPLGGELTEATVSIPEIRLEGVGNEDGGQTVKELIAALTQVLLEAVVRSAGDVVPSDLLQDLKGPLARLKGIEFDLDQGAGAKLKALGKKAAEAGKELGKKAGELGGEVGEKAGELLEKGAKGLDGLLKKKD